MSSHSFPRGRRIKKASLQGGGRIDVMCFGLRRGREFEESQQYPVRKELCQQISYQLIA